MIKDYHTGIKNNKTFFKRRGLGLKGGIGIGLTLVNQVIKFYGGLIQVKDRKPDNPLEGSNFFLQIPSR